MDNEKFMKRSVTSYFKEDKPVWACYDATRKLPSYIDGLKNSQRKLVWVAFNKISHEFMKTETYCNIVSLDTAYIHGSGNLCSVCASLVQNFIGACSYPYFLGNDGGWGSRLITRESAPRYTKVKIADITKKLFNPTDNEIYERQYFEGQYIEPKYLVPIFPTILLNNSNGITAGFAENIYARNPDEVISYIRKKLNGTERPRMELAPWFNGYKGEIRFNKELNVYESVGHIEQNNMTSYTITEIPIETSYQKYIETLDSLIENGTIQDYEDRCNPRTNDLLFEIKTTRDFTRKHGDLESLYKVLKLVKSLPEQYNCIDENGCVKEFNNVFEILDSYMKIRLKLYDKRKTWLLDSLKSKLVMLSSKYLFIEAIVNNKLVVNKKKKDEIVAQLEKLEKIKKVNDSYDYLLALPIHSLTKEKMEELKKQIEDGKDEYKKIKETAIETMWLDDLAELRKALK